MSEALVIRSFAGGELSPTITVRADLQKYAIGLRTCRNFTVERYGAVANRAGTRHVHLLKSTIELTRILRYKSEVAGASVLIEMAPSALRFFLNGARVEIAHGSVTAYNGATAYVQGDLTISVGVVYYCIAATTGNAPPNAAFWYPLPLASAGVSIYEIPTPFTLPRETNWEQNGRVITFTHHSHRPHDLAFVSITRWVLVALVSNPGVSAPTGVALTGSVGTANYAYKVCARAPETFEESDPSTEARDTTAAEPTVAAPHEITWNVVTVDGVNCPEYNVYCDPNRNGTFGFIGTATGQVVFYNPGITPDYGVTPPQSRDLFAAAADRPSTCSYHKQRRYFGNTLNVPDALWASRVGFPDNFGISSPLQDDDSLSYRIAGNNNHAVRYLVALKKLLHFTDAGEWSLVGLGGVIAPNTLDLDQETYVGIAETVRPVVIGNSVIYVQARKSVFRELRFDQQVEGFAGKDLTLFANHLVDNFTIQAADYAQIPDSIVWAVRSDGTLIALTYIHEQDVFAWHRHDTNQGLFGDLCVVPEADRDAVYVTCKRAFFNGIPGPTPYRHALEVFESRALVGPTLADYHAQSFFLDGGLSYAGAPISVITGLDVFDGMDVQVIADGVNLGQFTIDPGGPYTIDITPVSASNIHVGIPIAADFEPLNLDQDGTNVRDKKKRIQGAALELHDSAREFFHGRALSPGAGQGTSGLEPYVLGRTETAAFLYSGRVEYTVKGGHDFDGRYFLRHTKGSPLRILGAIPLVEVGG